MFLCKLWLYILLFALYLNMAQSLVHITEDRVRQLLDWESTVDAVQESLKAVSEKRVIQNPRSFTPVGKDGVLLSMPGYVESGPKSVLVTKLVTSFTNNTKRQPPLSSILANIFLFDVETGQLKCIIEGNEITAWRTAAASVVATKYLHDKIPDKKNEILAIIGAGTQGRIHAIALHHFFNFTQVRIWNRTPSRVEKLVEELKEKGIPAIVSPTVEECVKDADVIVTATYATSPLVLLNMVKANVHINAVGAGLTHYSELGQDIYKKSNIYVDHLEGANVELAGLLKLGLSFQGELGEVIINEKLRPDGKNITIFHSLGMAAEDGSVGQLVYERHIDG